MATCAKCGRSLSRYTPGRECGACAWGARAQAGRRPPLDDDIWNDPSIRAAARNRDLQQILRRYIDATGLTQEAVALLIGSEQGTVSKIIRGHRKRFTVEDLEAIRDGLCAPGHLFGLIPGPHESHDPLVELAGEESGDSLMGSLVSASSPTHTRDEDVERRELLQLAALGVSAGALGSAGEPVRQLLALLTKGEFRDLDGWHLTLSDHLYAMRTRPASDVRDGLLIDLAAIQRQLRSSDTANVVELHRIAAGLAMLCSNVLTRLGDHGAAIRWWRTARGAADASGDLDLSLMVRAEEAGCGLYGQRDPNSILLLLDRAEHLANAARTAHSFWLADFAGTRAKALTLIGRSSEAEQALGEFVSSIADARRAGGGLLPDLWKEDQVHFAESWVYAYAGDEIRAERARSNVLRFAGDYQYAANVRLHGALCTVVNGGITVGVQQASEILDALPANERTNMINETARSVLSAVPPEHSESPAVRDLRSLTVSAGSAGS